MSLSIFATRFAATGARLQASRPLSTQTEQAVSKLRAVFEEYRQEQFKKDIVRAASSQEGDLVVRQSVERVLHNIGASDRLTSSEVQQIFHEVGDNDGMPPSQFLKIL